MVAQVFDKVAGLKQAQFCKTELGLNISFCPFTTDNDRFTMIAYNPQGQQTTQVFRVPISSSTASVVGSDGSPVLSQVVPLTQREISLSRAYLQFQEMSDKQRVAAFTNNATHVVTFVAQIPAVGYETFEITSGAAAIADAQDRQERLSAPSKVTLQ